MCVLGGVFFSDVDFFCLVLRAQIDLSSGVTTTQVVASDQITDSTGTRQPVLLVLPNTSATMTYTNGTTVPLTNPVMRITEYTVGPSGPRAMPAELPTFTGYTYV